MYLIYRHNILFLNIYMHVFVFIYKYTVHTHIVCKQKRLFLDAFNRLTALI